MTANDYQIAAMRTLSEDLNASMRGRGDTAELIDACLGLSGETGEITDMVKKWLFHDHSLDENKLKLEVGDVCWYIALLCHYFNWELNDVMKANIDKLYTRYPDGFDFAHSKLRFDEEK